MMDKLNTILREHVAQGDDTTNKLLGAAFVLVNKNEIIYSGSAGRIDIPTDSKPFSTNSFTYVASMTKLITTTCLMQLVERGLVGLDADIKDLIPELEALQVLKGFDSDDAPILEENTKPATLRNLLTHTVGLGYDLADPDLLKWSEFVGRTARNLDWSREGFNTPTKFPPGDGWYYGTAMDWAGLLLEVITGQKLGEYMEQHIFEPLGINDTGFWPEKLPQVKNRTVAWVYRKNGALEPGPAPVPEKHEVESGGAGLFTTAKDYALFLRGLLQGKLVREETLKQMFTPQLSEPQIAMLENICYNMGGQDGFAPEFPKGLKLSFGLGGVINTEDSPNKRRKGSMMWSGLCNSRWWIDRETGIGAALIVNVQPHGDLATKSLYNELELAVYEALKAE